MHVRTHSILGKMRLGGHSLMLVAVLGVLALIVGCGDDSSPTSPGKASNTVASVTLTASPSALPTGGGDVEITATVKSGTGSGIANQVVTFTTSKGTIQPSAVNTDANGVAKTKLTATDNATVKGTVGTVSSSDFTVSVKAAASLTWTLDPATPAATQPFKVNVSATRGGSAVSGKLLLTFGDGNVLDGGDMNGTKTVEYTYKNPGQYNLTVQVEESDGSNTRDTQRITVGDPPRGSGGTGDDIDASKVRWFADCNISGWPIEERVLDVNIGANEICVDYSGRGTKPTFDIGIPVDATVWVFAQFNGVWYGATWDHLRPGAFCKAENAYSLGSEQIMRAPMDASWVPRRGDQVGFMVSGGYVRHECDPQTVWRTNIKLITWP